MFLTIYLTELKKNLKGAALAIFTGLVSLGVFLFVADTDPGVNFMFISFGREWHNAPLLIAKIFAAYSLVGILFTMVVVGRAVTRDFEARIHDFFFTLPLGKLRYLGGRFLGSLTANLLIFSGVLLGFFFASFKLGPANWGPLRLSAYVWPLIWIVIPNVLLMGSVFFSFATLTRKMATTYVCGVAFLLLYSLAVFGAFARIPNDAFRILADPFAISALNLSSKFWTVAEINARSMPLTFPFILNRVIWLAVAMGIWIFTVKKFRFVSVLDCGKKDRTNENGLTEFRPVEVPQPLFTPTSASPVSFHLKKIFSLAGREFKRIVFHPAFIILTVTALAQIVANFLLNLNEEGNAVYPFTWWYLQQTDHIWFYMLPLTVLFGGMIVWRERDHESHEFYDTLPLPDWLCFAAKLLTLVWMQLWYLGLAMAAGIFVQVVVLGFTDVQPGLYLKGLFAVEFIKYFHMAVVVLLIQNLAPSKTVGFFLSTLYFAADVVLFALLKVDLPFLRYGHLPTYQYSPLNGFGHYGPMMLWYTAYWLFLAAMSLMITSLLWRRGSETSLKKRWRLARQKAGKPQFAALALFFALFAGSGSHIVYNRYVLNAYVSENAARSLRAAYEIQYGRTENVPQPRAVAVQLQADLYPQKRAAFFKGHYLLKNETAETIREVYVNLDDRNILRVNRLEFVPRAVLTAKGEEFGFRVFRPARPLPPGAEITLEFDLEARARGFSDNRPQDALAANGTCILFSCSDQNEYLPSIGFAGSVPLEKAHERRKFGLPEPRHVPSPEKADRSVPVFPFSLVRYDAVISTSGDQAVISNGELNNKWRANGRNYFHYRSETPIVDALVIASGSYRTAQAEHRGVHIEVYHHPRHGFNVPRIILGLRKGLDYCSANYAPYPQRVLRIVEIPDYMEEGGARSQPTLFIWREKIAFASRLDDPRWIDSAFAIAVHELGHQWWAFALNPARAEGALVLAETLSQYVEVMCLQKEYGKKSARKLLKEEMEAYLAGRKRDLEGERPLARSSTRQHYLNYEKGMVAMYALQDSIGEDAVNLALQRLLNKFPIAGGRFPTSLDMLDEFRALTPPHLQYLIGDLFERITLYENRMRSAACEKTADGSYRVKLDVSVRKFYADRGGRQAEAPLDDDIAVGVFDERGEELYLQKHRFSQGESHLDLTVPRRPARAGIDPYFILVDRDREDNLLPVRETRRD